MRSERWCAASRASSSAIRCWATASLADAERVEAGRLEADRVDGDLLDGARLDADRLVTIWFVGGCWALPTREAPRNARSACGGRAGYSARLPRCRRRAAPVSVCIRYVDRAGTL